jgi:hypothetical protein
VPYRLVEPFKEIPRKEFIAVVRALAKKPGFEHLNEPCPHPTNPTEKQTKLDEAIRIFDLVQECDWGWNFDKATRRIFLQQDYRKEHEKYGIRRRVNEKFSPKDLNDPNESKNYFLACKESAAEFISIIKNQLYKEVIRDDCYPNKRVKLKELFFFFEVLAPEDSLNNHPWSQENGFLSKLQQEKYQDEKFTYFKK